MSADVKVLERATRKQQSMLEIEIGHVEGRAINHLFDKRQVVRMDALIDEFEARRDSGVVFQNRECFA